MVIPNNIPCIYSFILELQSVTKYDMKVHKSEWCIWNFISRVLTQNETNMNVYIKPYINK